MHPYLKVCEVDWANLFTYFCGHVYFVPSMGKQVSAAYLPSLRTNESRVRSPVPALYALGFQSKFASAGFSPGTPVFLLHLKLDQKRSKIWSEDPPGKQWYTLSEATLSKYLFIYLFTLAPLTAVANHTAEREVLMKCTPHTWVAGKVEGMVANLDLILGFTRLSSTTTVICNSLSDWLITWYWGSQSE